MKIRRAADRGYFDHGWLRTYHTFSFADYYDPANMGFRTLRVINEDRVAPAQGFGTHPHRDMEIITYVLEGALQHRDSMGNGSVIRPGEVQRMTAGTGVTLSEFNASSDQLVHLLQIWILPERRGLVPGYEQKVFPFDDHKGSLLLIASRDGREESVTIHQDARVFAGRFGEGQGTQLRLPEGRQGWLQVARGTVTLGDATLIAGDGASWSEGESLPLVARTASEVVLFDLA